MTTMPDPKPKKVYTPPRLKKHGDVRQLTRAQSAVNLNKDGGPNNTKSY